MYTCLEKSYHKMFRMLLVFSASSAYLSNLARHFSLPVQEWRESQSCDRIPSLVEKAIIEICSRKSTCWWRRRRTLARRLRRKRAIDAAALEWLLDFWLLLHDAAGVAGPWLLLLARMELGYFINNGIRMQRKQSFSEKGEQQVHLIQGVFLSIPLSHITLEVALFNV